MGQVDANRGWGKEQYRQCVVVDLFKECIGEHRQNKTTETNAIIQNNPIPQCILIPHPKTNTTAAILTPQPGMPNPNPTMPIHIIQANPYITKPAFTSIYNTNTHAHYAIRK